MRLPRQFRDVFRSLRNPSFRIYALSGVPALITDWMTRVAVGWLGWELTQSATWLGILGFVELFPSLVLGIFTGALADRYCRLRLMILSQFLLVTQAAGLTYFVYADMMTIELLVALNLYFGIIKTLDQPARHSLIPGLVRSEDISTAIGFDSVTFNTARIIGPIIAGAIIIADGVGPIFALNTLCFTVFMIGLCFIKSPPKPTRRTSVGFAGSIWQGLQYSARHPGIGPLLILLTVISVVARPLINFIPGFAGEVFESGADGQAILTAAMGLGAMAASMYLTQRAGATGLTAIFIAMVGGLGVALIVFTSNAIFWLGTPAMVILGFTIIVNGLGSRILVQNAATPDMRGRVASLYTLILRGPGAIGAVVLGLVADVIGLQMTFFYAGLLSIAVWLWARRVRSTMEPALETRPNASD